MLKKRLQNLLADYPQDQAVKYPGGMARDPFAEQENERLSRVAGYAYDPTASEEPAPIEQYAAAPQSDIEQIPDEPNLDMPVVPEPANQLAKSQIANARTLSSAVPQEPSITASPVEEVPTPELSGYQDDLADEAYKKQLEIEQEDMRRINQLRAINMLGDAALRGVHKEPSSREDLYAALERQAKGPVAAIEARRKGITEEETLKQGKAKTKEAADTMLQSDPNSDISRAAQEWAIEKLGLPEETVKKSSYKNLQKLMDDARLEKQFKEQVASRVQQISFQKGGVSDKGTMLVFDPRTGQFRDTGVKASGDVFQVRDPLTGETQLVNRRTTETVRTVGSPEVLEEGAEFTRKNLNPNQRKAVDDLRKQALKDETIKAAREAASELDKTKSLVKANVPGSAGAVRRSLLKMFESGGRFTDQDVAQFGGSQAVLSRLERKVQEAVSGKPFTKEDQLYFSKLIEIMNRENKIAADKASRFYIDDLVKRGIPGDYAEKVVTDELIPAGTSSYSEAQERGIKRVMDSNKISRDAAIKALKKAGKL